MAAETADNGMRERGRPGLPAPLARLPRFPVRRGDVVANAVIGTIVTLTLVFPRWVAAPAISGQNYEHRGLLAYAIGALASCSAAVALGLYGGARARVIEGFRERAERADREKELLAERAVAQERIRIAQELHDVVAHNVSLMLGQAQALGATVHDDRVAETTHAIAQRAGPPGGRSRPDGEARTRGPVRRNAHGGAAARSRLRGHRHAALLRRRLLSPLRVVIADDQPMMRAGFKAVLESTGNIKVVAEAGTGEEAVRAATELNPDVVLMDIRMPGMDGIEATRLLPRQRVLILTTFGLGEYIINA